VITGIYDGDGGDLGSAFGSGIVIAVRDVEMKLGGKLSANEAAPRPGRKMKFSKMCQKHR